MKKRFGFTCPHCHSEFTEVQDSEFYAEDVEIKLSCTECQATWRETFKIDYCGYSYNGKDYDSEGDEI